MYANTLSERQEEECNWIELESGFFFTQFLNADLMLLDAMKPVALVFIRIYHSEAEAQCLLLSH